MPDHFASRCFHPPIRSGFFALVTLALGMAFLPAQEVGPAEYADTSSPRATLESFLAISNRAYRMVYDEAHGDLEFSKAEIGRVVDELLQCLDMSEEAEFSRRTTGTEGAICLKEMLDRVQLPSMDQVPGANEIQKDSETGFLESWRVPGSHLTIHRISDGPREGEYLFSPDSIQRSVSEYESYKGLPYQEGASVDFYAWYLTQPGRALVPVVSALPEKFRTHLVGRHALWQWSALAILVLLGFIAMTLAYFFGRRMGGRFRETNLFRYALTLLFPIAAMLVPLLFIYLIEDQVRLAGKPLAFFSFSASVVLLLTGMIVIHAVGIRIAEFIISNPRIHPKGLDAQLVRIIARVLSLVAAVIVFLEGGKYLGIPLSTLLASAGVGGLALALAAQDSLKNFFGSMMIILDKPYRVGERIVIKNYDGIVEEIGLRSTRLRLLSGHQATIPNEEMARSDIENIGRRPFIRRLVDLGLPMDTPPEKMAEAVDIVSEILADHEGMKEEFPPRVYHTDINRDALIVRFIYWYHPPEFWDYLAFSQQVNLQILQKFSAAGIGLEHPLKLEDVTGDSSTTDEPESGETPRSSMMAREKS